MGAHLEHFKIGMGSIAFLYWVLVGILSLIIIYLIYILIKATIIKHSKVRKEWKKFYGVCERKRLTPSEITFLENLIKKYEIRRPIHIVRHLETFNRLIFREVYSYRGKETRKKENFKTFIANLRKKLGFADFIFLDELTSTREIPEGVNTKTSVIFGIIKKSFESKVVKVDEEGVVLTVPDSIMSEEPFRENQSVELNFRVKEDAEYIFNSVIYKVIPGPPGYICIDHSRDYSRIQKRRYERIDTEIPFKYFFLNPHQTEEFLESRKFALTKEIKYESGVIKNISGGGMYFINDIDLDIGTLIAISFKVDDQTEEIKNIIGRVERILDNDDDTFRIIIRFVKVKEPYRNQIIHYVFEKKSALKKEKIQKLKSKKKLTPA
ncbi:MAG: PilZ domain-containing protein [Candidatus Helarchaeota archaeon]|nr:PilZ domain-containing protein [Candidatus Helarchaeota archaeon]